ncbi:MAG: hypothetical protein ABW161_04260 [Candidatus Thiodiazotropha sp.]
MDTAKLQEIRRVDIGEFPEGIIADPHERRVYIAN